MDMMKTAMDLIRLSGKEQAKTITPDEVTQLAALRGKVMTDVRSTPLRVSDPFGLLNDD